ncbi:MAG: AI-2E family transporter [Defluviitaleaceae bacterium]|nr:AI-2E family transporter [Defluviitaleaceae bacterium]
MRKLLDPHQFKSWMAFLLLAITVIIIFQIVSEFETIFEWISGFFWTIAPFVWGFMLAYVLNIPREKIEALLEGRGRGRMARYRRAFSVALTYIGFIGSIWLLSILVFPRIYESITDFIAFLPSLILSIVEFFENLDLSDAIPFLNLDDLLYSFTPEEVMNFINIEESLTVVFDTIMAFFSFTFRFALSVISSVYFMVEADKIKGFVKRAFKAIMSFKVYEGVLKYGREVNIYFKRYIFCQVLDAIILGTIMTLVLSLLGVDYALTLGPMLGFANLIPYFGAIIGTIAAFVVIFITDGATMGWVAGVIMVIIQQIDANYIFPRLLGGSLKVSPLLVIIGITVGNSLYGIVGMIVAIPIVTVVRNMIDDILLFLEAKKGIKQRRDVEND